MENLKWMLDRITQEDLDAVDKASKAEFAFQDTGLTKEEWENAFGMFSPEQLAQLFILSERPLPKSPKEWKDFARECKNNSAKCLKKE